jgi:hypothetical protein
MIKIFSSHNNIIYLIKNFIIFIAIIKIIKTISCIELTSNNHFKCVSILWCIIFLKKYFLFEIN